MASHFSPTECWQPRELLGADSPGPGWRWTRAAPAPRGSKGPQLEGRPGVWLRVSKCGSCGRLHLLRTPRPVGPSSVLLRGTGGPSVPDSRTRCEVLGLQGHPAPLQQGHGVTIFGGSRVGQRPAGRPSVPHWVSIPHIAPNVIPSQHTEACAAGLSGAGLVTEASGHHLGAVARGPSAPMRTPGVHHQDSAWSQHHLSSHRRHHRHSRNRCPPASAGR